MTNSPNSSANNEVWWTEGSWTGVVTPRAVMILPPSVPQDLTERLWRLLRSEEASLTRALDELVMGMGGRLGAIPDFVVGVAFVYVFSVTLGWVPGGAPPGPPRGGPLVCTRVERHSLS